MHHRLVAATHRRLSDEVAAGRFREDLFYRIAVFELEVPPLRERQGDVVLLADHFLEESTASGAQQLALSPEAARLLESHAWPGNVRELENALQRASVLASGGEIRAGDLPPALSSGAGAAPGVVPSPTAATDPPAPAPIAPAAPTIVPAAPVPVTPEPGEPIRTLAELERSAIEAALGRSTNLSRIARELGIGRTTLYRKLEKYGLGTDDSEE